MNWVKRLSTRAFLLGSAMAAIPGITEAQTISTATTAQVPVTGTDSVTITSTGSITRTGAAILWNGDATGGGITINNAGTISVNGAGAAAIGINVSTNHAGPFTITNTGTITSANGPAIFTGSPNVPPFGFSTGPVHIINSGTISGNAVIPSAGPPNFAIVTGNGDDILEMTTDASITGRVFVGDGTDEDTLILSGTGAGSFQGESNEEAPTFVGWDGFDHVHIQSGAWTLYGGGYYESLTVDAGASMITDDSLSTGAVDGGVGPGRITDTILLTVNGTFSTQGSQDGSILYSSPTSGGDFTIAGNGTFNIVDASTFGLHSTNNTFTGDLNIANSGRFVLTGNFDGDVNLGANGTMIIGANIVPAAEPDTYQIIGPGPTGDMTGDINVGLGGIVAFNRTGSYTYGGDLSGSGSLVKFGAGVLTLSGNYTYTGQTRIVNGSIVIASQLPATSTLQVESGATLDMSGTSQTVAGLGGAGGAININSGALTIDTAASNTFSGAITGAGSLTIEGGGNLNLTGDNNYSGDTAINDGRLAVNGSIASDVTINNGGVLGGAGLITGAVEVAAGGIVAPGNSPGTLNVAGSFSFADSSIFQVEALSDGVGDKIVVTGGAATIGNDVTMEVLATGTGYDLQTDYVVLTATGGVTGAFDDVTSNLAFLDPTLTYGANDVTLRLTRNDVDFADLADSENQAGVAGAITSLPGSNPVFQAVVNVGINGAADAFNELSGEAVVSMQAPTLTSGFALQGQVGARLSDLSAVPSLVQLVQIGDAAVAVEPERDVSFWIEAFGSKGDLDGDAGAAGVDFDRSGVSIGVDTHAGSNARLGAALSYSQTDSDLDGLVAEGTADTVEAAIYGGTRLGAFVLRGQVGYSWHDIESQRQVTIGLLNEQLRAGYDGRAFGIQAELAAPMGEGKFTYEPFFGVNYISAETDAFTETGGSAALTAAESEAEITYVNAGVRGAYRLGATNSGNALFGSVAWRHADGDVAPQTRMAFASNPGAAFSVTGAPIAEDAAALEGGLHLSLAEGLALIASYRGDISDSGSEHGARVRLGWSF